MKTNKNNYVLKLTLSGLLLAVGVIIPRLFHMFGTPEMGKMFLPMHLSVFIAGIFLGKYYGLWIGFMTPLLNSLFGMPMFPFNVIMAVELSTYGFISGLLMSERLLPSIKIFGRNIKIYVSLIISMLLGRVAYALALLIAGELLGMKVPQPLSIFVSTITGIPGIIIQLIVVPIVVYALLRQTNKEIITQ